MAVYRYDLTIQSTFPVVSGVDPTTLKEPVILRVYVKSPNLQEACEIALLNRKMTVTFVTGATRSSKQSVVNRLVRHRTNQRQRS